MRWYGYNVVEIFPCGRQGPVYPASLKKQCCWWLSEARSQDISSYDIDRILQEFSDFSFRRGPAIFSIRWGMFVVRHLGIAPISRFGPRQLGIPSCRTQSRDWHATGIATWRPLREYWRSVSAQLPRQLAAFETFLMAHHDTGIFTDVWNVELCSWEFYSREKNCSCCACSISL